MENATPKKSKFGTFEQPEEQVFKETFKNFKLRQPDFSKGETQTTAVYKIIGALEAYQSKKAWFVDLNDKFVSVNWAFYHPKHCGYKATSKDDPSKLEYKAFVCPRKVKNKVELVPCAACAKAWQFKEALKAMREKAGKDPKAVAEMEASDEYKAMEGYLDSLWIDNKWKVLVMNREGEVGVLSLSKTTFQEQLYPLMMANKEGDFWVKFTSQGNNRTKTDKAEILTEAKTVMVEGTPMTVPIKVPCVLTEEQEQKILELAPDISKPLGAYYLTQDKINALVHGSGDPDEVATCFEGATTDEPAAAEASSLKSQLS